MTDEMSRAKAKVLEVYPEGALWAGYPYRSLYRVMPITNDNDYCIGPIGFGGTPEEAWLDAASHLPAEPKDEAAPEAAGTHRQARIDCEGNRPCGEWNCNYCHPETKFPQSEPATEAAPEIIGGQHIGKEVVVNHPRYSGTGILQKIDEPTPRVAWVKLQHGEDRWYEADTVHPVSSLPVTQEETANQSSEFLIGFALALAAVNRQHDQPTLIKDAMEGYGITVLMLKKAGVEDYDLKEIRKCMR